MCTVQCVPAEYLYEHTMESEQNSAKDDRAKRRLERIRAGLLSTRQQLDRIDELAERHLAPNEEDVEMLSLASGRVRRWLERMEETTSEHASQSGTPPLLESQISADGVSATSSKER